jgi:hypothetical protein
MKHGGFQSKQFNPDPHALDGTSFVSKPAELTKEDMIDESMKRAQDEISARLTAENERMIQNRINDHLKSSKTDCNYDDDYDGDHITLVDLGKAPKNPAVSKWEFGKWKSKDEYLQYVADDTADLVEMYGPDEATRIINDIRKSLNIFKKFKDFSTKHQEVFKKVQEEFSHGKSHTRHRRTPSPTVPPFQRQIVDVGKLPSTTKTMEHGFLLSESSERHVADLRTHLFPRQGAFSFTTQESLQQGTYHRVSDRKRDSSL